METTSSILVVVPKSSGTFGRACCRGQLPPTPPSMNLSPKISTVCLEKNWCISRGFEDICDLTVVTSYR